jgi:hypothetical protein
VTYVAIVVLATAAVVGAVAGIRRGLAPELAAPLLRIGTGVLLATAVLALVAGAAQLRESDAAWLVVDILILVLVASSGVVGLLQLSRLRARLTWARNWAMVSALVLLFAAALVLFD